LGKKFQKTAGGDFFLTHTVDQHIDQTKTSDIEIFMQLIGYQIICIKCFQTVYNATININNDN